MSRWLVTRGDRQFQARDLDELKQMARRGGVRPGDMIQPPGATDWLYASELPELKSALGKAAAAAELDEEPRSSGAGLRIALVAGLGGLILVLAIVMWFFASRIPAVQDLELLGDKGLKLTEMLVTADQAEIRSRPEQGGPAVGNAAKDSKVHLMAKRGPWYEVKSESGAQGWVKVDQVVPAYYFADSKVREDYDPIYNPDRYVFVKNSSWMQLPDSEHKNVTVFQFLLQNKSKFEMTDLKLLATIKDKNDRILETKEIDIEGSIPPYDGVTVGTLKPERASSDEPARLLTSTRFQELGQQDAELRLRWADGVEVPMGDEAFEEANIDLLQVRAVPKVLD